jgi:MFS family permease
VELTATTSREAGPNRGPLRALLAADAVSLVGNQISALAVPWLVLETTGSAARTGIVAAAVAAPTILSAFFGGALVDRLGYKRSSVLSDLASAVAVAAIPLLSLTGGLAFWPLVALVFLGAIIDAPGGAARGGLMPDLARLAGTPLERASAASETIRGFAGLAGPPLAGGLIAALGTSNVLWFDAATFLVSAGLVALAVPAPRGAPDERPPASGGYLAEVVEGLRFLMGDRLLRTILLTATAINFLVAPLFGVVMPVYAERRFGEAEALGALLAGLGAGTLAASVAFGAVGPRLPRRPLLIGGLALLGAPFPLLAAWPPLAVAVAGLVATGVAVGALNPLIGTLLLERTPAGMRGRVLGTVRAVALLATPVGMLLAGALTEALGVRVLLLGVFGAVLVVAASLLGNSSLREMERPPADG